MGKLNFNTQTEGTNLNKTNFSLNIFQDNKNTKHFQNTMTNQQQNQQCSFKIEDILNSRTSNNQKSSSSSSSSVSSVSSTYSPMSVENLIGGMPFFPYQQSQMEFLKTGYFNPVQPKVGKFEQIETTSEKLKLVNKYAKQIDALNESQTKKDSNCSVKSSKKSKLKSKTAKESCETCSGNCSELISSVLPLDQAQLPMCLRGNSEDQLHLASLFNTLMHHKKCRRTRTVFTDMQLIGLEKRFENQKYLSTPDRIQLAETLGLSQLQVKTWYQNRRMKWKKKVLKDGCQEAPTKPKGRPKKNSIPSFSDILKAASEAASNNHGTSNNESCDSRSNLSMGDEEDEDGSMQNGNDFASDESDLEEEEIDIEDESENEDDQDEDQDSLKSSNQSVNYLNK